MTQVFTKQFIKTLESAKIPCEVKVEFISIKPKWIERNYIKTSILTPDGEPLVEEHEPFPVEGGDTVTLAGLFTEFRLGGRGNKKSRD